jgi:hypothetical protein
MRICPGYTGGLGGREAIIVREGFDPIGYRECADVRLSSTVPKLPEEGDPCPRCSKKPGCVAKLWWGTVEDLSTGLMRETLICRLCGVKWEQAAR